MTASASKMSTKEVKRCINKLLYKSPKGAKDRELLSIVVLRRKMKHFKFLTGFTKWRTVGSWRQIDKQGRVVKEFPDEKNMQLDVQFKDMRDESIGKRLVDLFKVFNKRVVNIVC